MTAIANRYTLLAVLYYGALCVLSHIPGQTLAMLGFDIWDKAAHFSVYLVLGVLICLSVVKSGKRRTGIPALLFSALLILSLGIADEIHQLFVTNRFGSVGDVIADTLGGSAGIFIGHLITGGLFKTDKPSPAR